MARPISVTANRYCFTLFWDSFTHRDGFFVVRLAYPDAEIALGEARLPMYKVAQHGSTIIGFLLLVLVINGMKKYSTPSATYARRYWLITALIALGVIVIRFALVPLELNFGNLLVTSISGLLVGIFLSSLLNYRSGINP